MSRCKLVSMFVYIRNRGRCACESITGYSANKQWSRFISEHATSPWKMSSQTSWIRDLVGGSLSSSRFKRQADIYLNRRKNGLSTSSNNRVHIEHWGVACVAHVHAKLVHFSSISSLLSTDPLRWRLDRWVPLFPALWVWAEFKVHSSLCCPAPSLSVSPLADENFYNQLSIWMLYQRLYKMEFVLQKRCAWWWWFMRFRRCPQLVMFFVFLITSSRDISELLTVLLISNLFCYIKNIFTKRMAIICYFTSYP